MNDLTKDQERLGALLAMADNIADRVERYPATPRRRRKAPEADISMLRPEEAAAHWQCSVEDVKREMKLKIIEHYKFGPRLLRLRKSLVERTPREDLFPTPGKLLAIRTRKAVSVAEWDCEGEVYFVRSGQQFLKIGYSKNATSRISSLRTGSPVQLRLVGTLVGTQAIEHEIHDVFKEHRETREWFRWSEPVEEAMVILFGKAAL